MSTKNTTPATSAVVAPVSTGALTFPDIADERKQRDPNKPSIRFIIMEGLRQGKSTASIAAVVKQFHPDTAAAAKSSKHIGYYRSLMKKAGQLPASK